MERGRHFVLPTLKGTYIPFSESAASNILKRKLSWYLFGRVGGGCRSVGSGLIEKGATKTVSFLTSSPLREERRSAGIVEGRGERGLARVINLAPAINSGKKMNAAIGFIRQIGIGMHTFLPISTLYYIENALLMRLKITNSVGCQE